MKFQDILESPVTDDDEILQLYHNVYQECQPFLQQIDNQPYQFAMYRGMQDRTVVGIGLEDDFGIKTVRLTNRHPMDTPQEGHDAFNEYFEQEYGHPYRNGLFVSGNEHMAEAYGHPYAVFPIGKFEYIWNQAINDLTTDIYDFVDIASGIPPTEHPVWVEFFNSLHGGGPRDPVSDSSMKVFLKNRTDSDLIGYVMKDFGRYNQDNLKKGIYGGGEIMIWCEEYYYMQSSLLPALKAFISK